MTKNRDRWIVIVAVVAVIGIATAVMAVLVDVQRRGRHALERERLDTVQQLGRSMDARLKQVDSVIGGVVSFPWTLEPNGAADLALLNTFQRAQPDARTGYILIDRSGSIVNGTLLRSEHAVGSSLTRQGIAAALAGKITFLPVGPGITTALPTFGLAAPLPDGKGGVRGAFIFEGEVSPSSPFNAEVAQLGGARRGDFSYIDEHGIVIGSSNPTLIGRPLPDATAHTAPAGLRRSNGILRVVEIVPRSGWRAVNTQPVSSFEEGLTQRVQVAIILLVLLAVALGGGTVVALVRRLRALSEEQRRMRELAETREQFISIVSHELRTPVAGVMGFLETTLDHWDAMDDDARRHAVSRAHANARRLHVLTRDVLDTSSLETGKLSYSFDVVDLRGELELAVTAARDLSPDRIVSLAVPDAAVWVRADADRVQQVISNLLDNAMKSSPADREIRVDLRVVGDDVEVDFIDRGAGLSTSDVERVFEKFVRGRDNGVRGTGLGLFISRQIIDAHDGRIWASGNDGAGATFTFALPLVTAPAAPVS